MEENHPAEPVQADDYKSVIDSVLSQSQTHFQEEGIDSTVVERLKQIWLSKFEATKNQQKDQEIKTLSSCSAESALTPLLESKLTLNACQVDGAVDTSDEEDAASSDDAVSDDADEDKDPDDQDMDDGGPEEEPLGSGDDITDEEDPSDLFDTDNVIVCQYEKITRIRNKWKFHLKYGIMNLNGEDYVFQKADGDAEW